MTINNPTVKLESRSFEEWGVPLSLPLLQVPLQPGLVVLLRVPTIYQIEVSHHLLHKKPFICEQIKLLVLDSNT